MRGGEQRRIQDQKGGRESKLLDAAPEKKKKIGQKTNIGRKKGGGAAADSASPWIRHCGGGGGVQVMWNEHYVPLDSTGWRRG